MSFWSRVFGWWDRQTLNTRFWTWRYGNSLGEDALGNAYYQSADGKRRWVIYAGEAEASAVPVEWHAWLHHTTDEPPTRAPLPRKPWERPGQPNQTGMPGAYRPAGSLLNARPPARRDYDAWTPE